MNSIPQQAVANGNGQREFFRAQETISSRRVTRKSTAPPPAFAGPSAGSVPLGPSELMGSRFYGKGRARENAVRSSSAEVDRVGERLHVAHAIEVDEPVEVVDLVL